MYPIDFGSVHTVRLLQLRNGNYCIGGYYGTNDDSETIGYFFYIIVKTALNQPVEIVNNSIPNGIIFNCQAKKMLEK